MSDTRKQFNQIFGLPEPEGGSISESIGRREANQADPGFYRPDLDSMTPEQLEFYNKNLGQPYTGPSTDYFRPDEQDTKPAIVYVAVMWHASQHFCRTLIGRFDKEEAVRWIENHNRDFHRNPGEDVWVCCYDHITLTALHVI